MNNLSSYCGLVDAKYVRASDKHLPVYGNHIAAPCNIFLILELAILDLHHRPGFDYLFEDFDLVDIIKNNQ